MWLFSNFSLTDAQRRPKGGKGDPKKDLLCCCDHPCFMQEFLKDSNSWDFVNIPPPFLMSKGKWQAAGKEDSASTAVTSHIALLQLACASAAHTSAVSCFQLCLVSCILQSSFTHRKEKKTKQKHQLAHRCGGCCWRSSFDRFSANGHYVCMCAHAYSRPAYIRRQLAVSEDQKPSSYLIRQIWTACSLFPNVSKIDTCCD